LRWRFYHWPRMATLVLLVTRTVQQYRFRKEL
jgi:hypothetical protein